VALLLLHGKDAAAVAALEQRLAPVLWQADLPARVRCVRVVAGADARDAERVQLAAATGVSLVAPEPFGRTGEVLVHVDATAGDAELVAALGSALANYRPATKLATPAHIREGNRQGAHWETAVPVTDPGGGPGQRGGRGRGPGNDEGPPPGGGRRDRRGPPPPPGSPPPGRGL
jgi:hypothetical protein